MNARRSREWAAPVIEMDRDPGRHAETHDDTVPALTPEAQERIGQSLRRAYAGLLTQPLPDRFARLLHDLASPERAR